MAIVTRGGSGAGTRYVHVDHLGSVDALTDENGDVIERRSYDPFGQRRNPVWGERPPASFPSETTQGFTGHESDDELGLVNMKGRIYDPRIGRFLTTDPIISLPFFGQSWNPYSYVLNNPLASCSVLDVPRPSSSLPLCVVPLRARIAGGGVNVIMAKQAADFDERHRHWRGDRRACDGRVDRARGRWSRKHRAGDSGAVAGVDVERVGEHGAKGDGSGRRYAFGRAHPDAEQARDIGLPCDARATAGRRHQRRDRTEQTGGEGRRARRARRRRAEAARRQIERLGCRA
ncbi:RHS repeat-associated core domain-containing protein [Sorangium sp. So ce296]|uniref:RHS repeat domain-containing protein n=1 Tax=Sorangium sp. So ce296 TaxID=3133296 RepID=UPI003F5FE5DF